VKKVLFVCYYWPPSGGIGVHRCLKFVKYLRDFGWEPVVYAPSNPAYPIEDETNFKDIPDGITTIKQPIWEPYDLYKKLIGKKKEDRIHHVLIEEENESKVGKKIGIWIRGNFFIPDARRFWIKPSVEYLSRYLKGHHVDAVFSNGPPQSMHLIACGVKENIGIPWLADFQDPWTQVDYYSKFMISPIADKIHKRLEQKVFRTADKITICSDTWTKDLESIGAKNVGTIVWGFDEDDFKNENLELDRKFTISHFGSLGPDRNVRTLWKAFATIVRENSQFADDLQIQLVGFVDKNIVEEIKNLGLEKNIKKIDHINRDEALEMMCKTQVLLLILNRAHNVIGRLPGKLFEYLGARRPIINIGPLLSDAAKIISDAKAGSSADFDDMENSLRILKEFYFEFKKGQLSSNKDDISKYTNRNLTGKLASFLNQISAN
jgi:glycosyltransferase involved in cell wall biosynthesis